MEQKLYDYDFIFADMYGKEYEEIHWRQITPKDFNFGLYRLQKKYKVYEHKMLLKWIKNNNMGTKFQEQKPINVSGIRIFAHNTILDLGVGYISFARDMYETAVVLKGADGTGVMFLILNGDKRKEIEKVIEKYSEEKWLKDGLFGEIVAWACAHSDLNVERSTMGRWSSRCSFKAVKPIIEQEDEQ